MVIAPAFTLAVLLAPGVQPAPFPLHRSITTVAVPLQPLPRGQVSVIGMPLAPRTFRPRHVKSATLRRVIAGAGWGLLIGGVSGGIALSRDGCDMCGLAGAMYGAPIGAAVGALLGSR